MSITKTSIAALLFIQLVGCTTKPTIMAHDPTAYADLDTQAIDEHIVGKQERAYVGEHIVVSKQVTSALFYDTYATTSEEFVFVVGRYDLEFVPGKQYPIGGKTDLDGVNYFVVEVPNGVGEIFGVLVTKDGRISSEVINLGYSGLGGYALGGIGGAIAAGSLMIGSFKLEPPSASLQPANERRPVDGVSAAHKPGYTLTYYGLVNGEMRFSYREFDAGQQTFQQEMTYDTSDSTFRFRSYVVKVYEATSDYIEYSVAPR